MATTPNLGLHQWAAGDAFLRTDFNEDFNKIDEALGMSSHVKLASIVSNSKKNGVDVDLSGIDLTAFSQLGLHVSGSMDSTKEINLAMRVNGNSTKLYHCSQAQANINILADRCYFDYIGSELNGGCTLLLRLLDGGTHIAGTLEGAGGYRVYTDQWCTLHSVFGARVCGFAGLRTINFFASESWGLLNAGFKVTIYGIKA